MPPRLKKLIAALKKREAIPYLITSLINIRYLTGFAGSFAVLLVHGSGAYLISDSRYREYAEKNLPKGVAFVLMDRDLVVTLGLLMKKLARPVLYLEEHALTLSTFLMMKKKLKKVSLAPAGDEVNAIRTVKDEDEIAVLREAAAVTDSCFYHLLSFIRPGMSEWDVSVEIEHYYRSRGCSKTSFDTIVASGSGSSMPHYATSAEKRIAAGDVVMIDMGCVLKGYNSDLTRTVFVATVDARLQEIYHVVNAAREMAVLAVRPGVTTGFLDNIARSHIADKGFGECFGHSLGHGVGLDVHELPAVKSGGEHVLKAGTVITIEPGIYLPGVGGVRIEDMALVTRGGCELLTQSTRDIVIL